MPIVRRRRARPLGLALGGGSARGYAHIGVLKVLESAGIKPDLITGTSIGAVMGALSATGYTGEDIERLVSDIDLKRLVWFARPHPSRSALLDLRGFMRFLGDLLPRDFSELEVPFACVSTDLITGAAVVHREGDLLAAIRGSIAVPVAFEPAADGERVLVDGGLVEPVPIDTARSLGARTVVAVTLSELSGRAFAAETRHLGRRRASDETKSLGPTRRWQIAATSLDIMERRIASMELQHADVVLAPALESYSQLAFLDATPLIELGAAATEAALPEILRLLK